MTKSKSINEKVKSVGKSIGKALLTTAGVALISQSVNAQMKSDYKNHDKGAIFKEYSAKSNDLLEEKVFYNAVTKKEERFYVQALDKNLYENDLNKALLPFYNTMPIMGAKTGDVDYLVADTAYALFPIKEKSLEITASHVPDRCDDQIRDIADVTKGVNYISTSYVKDYFQKLSKDMVLELENGESFLILTLPKEKQVKGKTNQLYIPLDDKHHWGVDPKTKKLWVFGDIYQGSLIEDKEGAPAKVGVSGSTGLASKLGEKDTFAETVEEAGKKEAKVAKDSTYTKKNLYLIFGAEGNKDFVGGKAGVGLGPFAVLGNYGAGQDENVLNITTEASPITGRYGTGTTVHENLKVKGANLELHLLRGKRISPYLGTGFNNWTYNIKDSEQIRAADGTILSENSNSRIGSENSLKGNAGVDVKLGKSIKLGVEGQYDTKAGPSGGVRLTIGLN